MMKANIILLLDARTFVGTITPDAIHVIRLVDVDDDDDGRNDQHDQNGSDWNMDSSLL